MERAPGYMRRDTPQRRDGVPRRLPPGYCVPRWKIAGTRRTSARAIGQHCAPIPPEKPCQCTFFVFRAAPRNFFVLAPKKKWMPRVAYHPRKARQTMHGSRFPWMHACAGAAGVDKSSLSWPSFLPFQAITPQPTLLELKRSFVRVGWRRGTWSAIRFSHAVNGLVMPCSHLSPLSQFLLRFYTLNPKP